MVDLFPSKALLAWQVRTGKTLTAISLANKVGLSALFIVPKQLLKQWAGLLKEHSIVPYSLLTKEQFKALAKGLGEHGTIVVDEAHHFSGMKSELSKQLERYIKRWDPKHIYLLTGTPYRSTPWNIYRLAQLLGHKWNYMEFQRKFFIERFLGRRSIFVPRTDCQDELADLVRTIGSIVRLEDCTDMPKDPVPIVETLPMTDEQKELIKTIEANETDPLVRFGKKHQAASGVLLGNEFAEDINVPCNKDLRIINLIEEYDRALVFCRYNMQLERYQKLFTEAGIPSVIINGKTKDIDKARDEVRNLKYGAALINMSCSEGYDFSGYSLTIYGSLSYSYLDFEQSSGRTKHMEKKVPNVYVILNCEGSNDLPVWQSIGNKQSFSESIFIREHLQI